METYDFERTIDDDYERFPAYIKTIFEYLPDDDIMRRDYSFLEGIYKSHLENARVSKLAEIKYISAVFEEKFASFPKEEAEFLAKYYYNFFIYNIIWDRAHRPVFINNLNENIKSVTGFYSPYQDKVFSDDGSCIIREGSYR